MAQLLVAWCLMAQMVSDLVLGNPDDIVRCSVAQMVQLRVGCLVFGGPDSTVVGGLVFGGPDGTVVGGLVYCGRDGTIVGGLVFGGLHGVNWLSV